ncbi:MAG: nucleoside hydrolase [Actinomycetia bacterium]|nr:nucleoside hydrolase [Actinomycetes bacterium]
MAIFMALASPELDVVGLTTIFGNAATVDTTRNARVLLDAAGRDDIPVSAGASAPLAADYIGPVPWVHGHNGLGDAPIGEPSRPPVATSAHEFLYEMAAADPGAITLLAVGPLTNLGLLLQHHPDAVDLFAEVVVMGGNALVPGNATPVAEANINNDPEAADLVFGAKWRVTMVGLDVTHKVNLSGAAIDRISAVDTPTAALLAAALPLYRNFFETRNHVDGIFVHDPSAVAYLLDPDAFTTEQWPIRVETESFSRGKTWPNMGDTDDAAPPAWRGRPAVNVCTEVDAPWVLRLVEERLTRY